MEPSPAVALSRQVCRCCLSLALARFARACRARFEPVACWAARRRRARRSAVPGAGRSPSSSRAVGAPGRAIPTSSRPVTSVIPDDARLTAFVSFASTLFSVFRRARRRCDGRRSHEGLVPLQRPLPGDHAMTRKQRTRAQIRKRQGTQSTTSESGADQRRRHRAGGANGRPPRAATTCPLN